MGSLKTLVGFEKFMPPRLSYAAPTDPLFKRLFIQSMEWWAGKRKLEAIYEHVLLQHDAQTSLWKYALEQINVRLAYDFAQLTKVPNEEPVIFIANHPYGLLDGLAICHLVTLCRPNFKILIHQALCVEESLLPYMLPIDFRETKEAIYTNIESKRNALSLLRQGGAVIIFPAGGTSNSQGPFGRAVDMEWKPFVGKLVQMAKATVIPIYFHGQNSRLFQIVSQVYSVGVRQEGRWGKFLTETGTTLRASLFIHELFRQMGNTLRIEIGDPISYETLSTVGNRGELVAYLRGSVYALGEG